MAKKNPFKGAMITVVVAAVLALITFLVIKPHQEAKEKSETNAALLYPSVDKSKVVEFKFTNSHGSFDIKRKADAPDTWFVTAGKTFDADKASVDGLLSTILAAKKESTIAAGNLASLGLEPAKFRLQIPMPSDQKGAAPRELLVGEDTPVDYFVYAKWSDSPEVFLTTRSLRFSIDKKIDELRNKKVFSVKENELAKIELKSGGIDKHPPQNLSFEKNEKDVWHTVGHPTVNLDSAEIEKFLGSLKGLTIVGFLSEDPAERPKFGLNRRPLVTLTLTPAEGKGAPVTWVLGSFTEKTGKESKERFAFARTDGESTFEVGETFPDNFKVDLFRFRKKSILSLSKDAVRSLSLQDGLQSIQLKKEGSGWQLNAKTLQGEVTGAAKADVIERAIDGLVNLKPVEFFDGHTPYQTGLRKPSRIVTLEGEKAPLATVFFGKTLPENKIVVRTEGMDAAASVVFNLEEVLPLNPAFYLASAPVAAVPPAAIDSATAGQPNKGAKVKLEPTVQSPKEIQKLPASIVKPGNKYSAEVEFTNGKKLTITLAADKAPYTVSNFIHLARNNFYNGVKFHRVIADFMAQGGDPTGTGTGGPGFKFDNEDNDLKHKKGSISMAHAGRNTNGSQFFLVFKPQPHLDGVHTVFGEVTSGLDVLEGIKQGDVMKTVTVFEEAN